MIVDHGVRIGWVDLPMHVRSGVEALLGSPVVQFQAQVGGFSPGSADRVRTREGRRAFVKAVGAEQNDATIHLYRREAVVAARLPTSVPAPAFIGLHDDPQWVALVFDDVAGRHPSTPWVAAEIHAAMAALSHVAAASDIAAQLPDVASELADDLAGWERIAADPPANLRPWAGASLDQLRALAGRAVGVLHGDDLVHTDIRADNLLVRDDSTIAIVDWPWAARGPAWLDRLLLLVNVNLYGGHDMATLLSLVDAPGDDIAAVLAGLTGYFIDVARRPPTRGLPTVRAFQAEQGRRTLAWLTTLLEA